MFRLEKILLIASSVVITAFHLKSPISVIWPFEDVHKNCDQEVLEYCYNLEESITKKVDASRKLLEVRTSEVTVSHTYSLSFGVRINSRKKPKNTSKRVKDNTRFLNYGPATDTCLWNIYDEQKVSEKCASALKSFNDGEDSELNVYDDNNGYYSEYAKLGISFSGFSVLIIYLSYLLIKQLVANSDTDDEDEDTVRDQSGSEHHEGQLVDESTEIFVAVPMRLV